MAQITFAIPFYKGIDHLKLAIHSVFTQSFTDWKLVLVDNGANEEAKFLVASLGDSRCSYVANEQNLGMAGNFNRCLDLAETDLVTLLHHDDELMPNYASTMIEAAAKYKDGAAFFCQTEIINDQSKRIFSIPDMVKSWTIPSRKDVIKVSEETEVAALLKGCFIMAPSICYRKSRVKNIRFSGDWKMVLDLDFYLRLIMSGEHFIGLPDVCYRYRRHSNNVTVHLTSNMLRFQEEVAVYNGVARHFAQLGWLKAAKVASSKTIIKLNLIYCVLQDVLHFRGRAALN